MNTRFVPPFPPLKKRHLLFLSFSSKQTVKTIFCHQAGKGMICWLLDLLHFIYRVIHFYFDSRSDQKWICKYDPEWIVKPYLQPHYLLFSRLVSSCMKSHFLPPLQHNLLNCSVSLNCKLKLQIFDNVSYSPSPFQRCIG